jgi:hypothetical protein
MDSPAPKLILEDFNLEAAERRLCIATLEAAGNIVGAAQLLGITRHALKRRMIKLRIDRPGNRVRPDSKPARESTRLRAGGPGRPAGQGARAPLEFVRAFARVDQGGSLDVQLRRTYPPQAPHRRRLRPPA